MKIIFTNKFRKKLPRLPTKIQNQFGKRLKIFMKDPFNPLLKTHLLKGNLGSHRAFSITGDYRVIFKIVDQNTAKLIDIGTHAQVYE